MEPPSRYFVQVMSFFCKDELKRLKLKEFSSKTPEGKSEYYRYCIRERRTVLEVMQDFDLIEDFPLSYLISCCGRQKPREFSISSYQE
mmetsp:Transcript_88/g.101  ORF Transcript_88/g.101 Transcript_88/m.101 type:complete len:88 (+) Transcript_88:139-402(+)